MTAFPKNKPARNPKYLAYIRNHICCACGARTPSEAHHFGPHGVGTKCSDYLAVPLCKWCHRSFHDSGTLPGMSRENTEALFAVTQADALCAWIQDPGTIVKALVAHLEAES